MPIIEYIAAAIAYETFIEKTSSIYYIWSKYWYNDTKAIKHTKMMRDESVQTD